MTAPPRARGLSALWESGHADEPFDVLVVGSGYGGSMAAATFAGSVTPEGRPVRVGMLERGRAYTPGEFPSRFSELPGHLRMGRQATGTVRGRHEGLFDIRLGEDVVAMVANGLGGGSLINAGVMLEPELDELPDGWRRVVAQLKRGGHFAAARRAVLGADDRGHTIERHADWRDPQRGSQRKFDALARLGRADAVPISVALDTTPNDAGVRQPACNLCGDCMTGCNTGAKGSLDASLLVRAMHAGAEVYTGATVLSLARGADGLWDVPVIHTDPRLQEREAAPLVLRAHRVVLAAGTFGSTEILLRSRSHRLRLSPRLGEGFSCNGDNIAAIHKMPVVTQGCADENTPPAERFIGPTVTGSVRFGEGRSSFRVQEFSVPGPTRRLFEELVTTAASLDDLATADWTRHGRTPRIDPQAVHAGHMRRSLLVGVIGHDEGRGTMRLPAPVDGTGRTPEPGTLGVHWPDARHGPLLNDAHARLAAHIASTHPRARLVANPMWRLMPPMLESMTAQPRGPVLTVHPLGGCGAGRNAQEGVVDALGRVFSADGAAWFGDLVVLDGAVVPASLGVNPALTITAFARRAARVLQRSWGWRAAPTAPLPVTDRVVLPLPPPSAPVPTEVQVIERLGGAATLALPGGPRACHVELTLAYRPARLQSLMTTLERRIAVDPSHTASRVRVYDLVAWETHDLRVRPDADREPHLLFEAAVDGQLAFLHREPSTPWQRVARAAGAWWPNRGMRDTFHAFMDRGPRRRSGVLGNFVRLATRAGEVRRFDYTLRLGDVRHDPTGLASRLTPGAELRGHKRLTYGRRANPWRQLTTLHLTQFPALASRTVPALTLDMRFLAAQGAPLLRITRQQDHACALAELTSFLLYFSRVIVHGHLWTFRRPDPPAPRVTERLPGAIRGLPAPDVVTLCVDARTDGRPAAHVQLTRYRHDGTTLPPVVMIHGYSVSGNTFTHPTLAPSAAAWFWHAGRDVWVVDLRTSTGLPTGTFPWSIEEVALVDIPAALLHVRQATGRNVDVFAHCIGCAMLSMALLTDADAVRRGTIRLGDSTRLTDAQLGVLDAFNGPIPRPGAHPCVRRVVLSQKGPVLRYTDDNVFRAYLMQTVRRWLLTDVYRFRPPAKPKAGDELLDRLLASLPYPDADYDAENPTVPWRRTRWTGTRHRMDALYGRDFNADNMLPETLDAIDDLFGPMNLDTVAQIIHFTRFNVITSQQGRGDFVTRRRLAERWRQIPTLAIHGQDNGLADVSTQHLLRAHLGAAGVPVWTHTFPGMGHQDVLIGKRSAEVFELVDTYLRTVPAPDAGGAETDTGDWYAVAPWFGPRFDGPALAAMSSPVQGPATLVLVPGVRRGDTFALLRDGAPVVIGDTGPSDTWLTATPGDAPVATDGEPGWFALMLHDADDCTEGLKRAPGAARAASRTAPGRPAVPEVVASPRTRLLADTDGIFAAAERLLALGADDTVESAFVRAHDIARAAVHREAIAPAPRFAFSLASCQYPAGLIDRPVAEAGLASLAAQSAELDLAVFAGDQIYADATGGLVDPARSDELYVLPHERALQVAPMRTVLRTLPVEMVADDHEFFDNWEPPHPDAAFARPTGDARVQGMAAYRKYQLMRPAASVEDALAPADRQFRHGGYPFYVADTRTGRQHRGSAVPAAERHILSAAQRERFAAWLLAHRDEVKFIVTPSMLLPARRIAEDALEHCHAWDAYPASMQWLLGFLTEHRIRRTVFLSGDEHHAMVARTRLLPSNGGPPVRVVSVHGSGMYCPYPFANGSRQDFPAAPTVDLGGRVSPVRLSFAPPGDGFVRLTVTHGRRGPRLAVNFAGGGRLVLLLD